MGKMRRMLIVDKHSASRRALRGIFSRLGWEVSEARTLADGLKRLTPPPQFVILDLALPDGRGEALLRQIRDDALPTRVAVCTGIRDPNRLEAVERLGADIVLRKPIDALEIYGVTETITAAV